MVTSIRQESKVKYPVFRRKFTIPFVTADRLQTIPPPANLACDIDSTETNLRMPTLRPLVPQNTIVRPPKPEFRYFLDGLPSFPSMSQGV